ncbi:hypothetical protein QIW53_24095 [Pseudomonas fluorescens]|uniref:hypothetical protein n=1 Tax=Pseudomonas fluorescens TaxID=294 RepID=UPI003524269B
MNIAQVSQFPQSLLPFGPAVLMEEAFDDAVYAFPRLRSMPAILSQVKQTSWASLEYCLPQSTRVGDVLEVFLIDSGLFPTLILKIHLDDNSLFRAIRRNRGIFVRAEINTSSWPGLGIVPGTYDLEVAQFGASAPGVPTPPDPAAQVPATPSRVVALSFLRSYVIT